MATFSSEQIAAAAARMSSGKPADSTPGVRGSEDTQWSAIRSQLARLLVSDPSSVFYFVWLCSNAAGMAAKKVVGHLETMIISAEGARLRQVPVPETATSGLKGSLDRVSHVTSNGGVPSAGQISSLKRHTTSLAAQHLVPNVTAGRRAQAKGSEAASSYGGAKTELFKEWKKLVLLVQYLSVSKLYRPETLITAAMADPLSSLEGVVAGGVPEEGLTEFMLDLFAGVSAIEGLSRPLDPLYKVRTLSHHPEGVSVVTETDPFSVFTIKVGSSQVDPRTLGIVVGDYVWWNGTTVNVTSVSSTTVTVGAELERGSQPVVTILSAEAESFKELQASLRAVVLPSTDTLRGTVQRLEGPSAGETRDLCEYLATVLGLLGELSSSVQSTLSRVGVDVEIGTPLRDITKAFNPAFSESTKSEATAVLDALRSQGFTRAERMLLHCRVSEVMLLRAADASSTGHVSQLASSFVGIGGPFSPTGAP